MRHYTKEDKTKHDEAVKKFAYEHPHLYHREIAFKFGISRSQVSSILRGE